MIYLAIKVGHLSAVDEIPRLEVEVNTRWPVTNDLEPIFYS